MSQSGTIGSALIPIPSDVPELFVTDAGNAIPFLHVLNVLGSGDTSTSGAGNTITITTNSSILKRTVTVTSQEIKALNGSPKTLIPAPAAGQSIQFIGAQAKYIYAGHSLFTGVVDLSISFDPTGVLFSTILPSNFYNTTFSQYVLTSIQASSQAIYPLNMVEGMPLVLTNNSPNVTGNASNDNSIVISLLYTIDTL